MTSVHDCELRQLDQIPRPEGAISVLEAESEAIPFAIARVFYVYDVVAGAVRGGHAHRELHQFVICPMGGFSVALWDGEEKRSVTLNRAYLGLYVPPLIWTDLVDFTSGAVCIVMASLPFDEADYFRDRGAFLGHRRRLARCDDLER